DHRGRQDLAGQTLAEREEIAQAGILALDLVEPHGAVLELDDPRLQGIELGATPEDPGRVPPEITDPVRDGRPDALERRHGVEQHTAEAVRPAATRRGRRHEHRRQTEAAERRDEHPIASEKLDHRYAEPPAPLRP